MITIDILETLEDEKDHIVGIQVATNTVLCVGKVPLETSIDQIPLGLNIIGTLADVETKFQKYSVSKTKVQKSKGNTIIQLKQLRLIGQQNNEIKVINAQTANDLLQHIICIQSATNNNYNKPLGYKYKGKAYLSTQIGELFRQLHSELKNYLKHTKKTRDNTKLLLQPLQLNIDIITTLKTPEKNILEDSQLISSPHTVVSFFRISDLSSPSEQDAHTFEAFLKNHLEIIYQKSAQHSAQITPVFLKRMPVEPPTKMFNIHQYLNIELLWQHTRYMCKGRYDFYHYLEQQFNDRGWGCAYRAFQTLLSWFNQQRYCSVPVPSIRDIQKQLFEIDKSRNLINTSEWIGANEVGWLVSRLCGVECKIVYLQDGQNIMQKVDIFRHHFQTSGTPIVYGGDMYAYTIVGINYSWELGECQFLIVDPHYTEENSFKQIVSKEGVYWRDKSKLFKKGVYYNFCLPQVPIPL